MIVKIKKYNIDVKYITYYYKVSSQNSHSDRLIIGILNRKYDLELFYNASEPEILQEDIDKITEAKEKYYAEN